VQRVALVPPAWEKAARAQFGDKRVMVIPATFSAADARHLARTLSTYRRVPVDSEYRPLRGYKDGS